MHLGPTATAIERSGRDSDIARRARRQADEFMADMQAQVALQRAAERDLAELEAQLAAAKLEALPLPDRIERAQRLVQERAAEISDLAEQGGALQAKSICPAARAGRKGPQGAARGRQTGQGSPRPGQGLGGRIRSLSPFRFIRRHQLKKQLPQARERARRWKSAS